MSDARTVDIAITRELLGSAGAHRHNRTSNYFLSLVARQAFRRFEVNERAMGAGVPGGALDLGLVQIQASRAPGLLADFIMAEIGAAERSCAVAFCQALIDVAKGDEVQEGMTCRLIGWEWRPYFMARKPGSLWRVAGNKHAVRKHEKDLSLGMHILSSEINAYRDQFQAVEGRDLRLAEPPPEWLESFVRMRLGIGEQQGLVFDAG